MKIFVIAGVKEIIQKARWFEKPICQVLKDLGMRFGFEIKGSVKGLKELNVPFSFGIHLSNNLATDWRNKEKRSTHLEEIELATLLNPQPIYAVLHGIRVDQKELPTTNFISSFGAKNYLLAFSELAKLIRYLQNLSLPVVIENVSSTEFLMEKGIWQPETYLDVVVGSLAKDLQKISKATKCDLLVDLEHLSFALNFAKRKFQYAGLENKIPPDLSPIEKKVMREFGIFLRPGSPPVIPRASRLSLAEEIKKIKAKIYHLSGSHNGNFLEFANKRIVSHNPISLRDYFLRKCLVLILKQRPEILVVEVASPKSNPCWAYLPQNSQEKSFENLCQILAEELKRRKDPG